MQGKSRSQPSGDRQHIREHLANERTFLAWIRTGVSILAFGFVVEKFSIYLRYLNSGSAAPSPGSNVNSSVFGFLNIMIAALVVILATLRFKQTQRQIDQGVYRPSIILDMAVAVLIIFVSFLMAVFWFKL